MEKETVTRTLTAAELSEYLKLFQTLTLRTWGVVKEAEFSGKTYKDQTGAKLADTDAWKKLMRFVEELGPKTTELQRLFKTE